MKTFLVGGAVRDGLLNRPYHDRDYVVVGSTVKSMLDAGFEQVGSLFPVFLHPETKDEYALARKEWKTGEGHTGFCCAFGPEVTLKEDLSRRDLTINALARDLETGELVNPFGGLKDLKNKVLRHIGEAFHEDPLRVLRVARFAATLGFSVAPETLAECKKVVNSGELETLPAERVYTELIKALHGPHPENFFQVLANVKALKVLFPEFHALSEVPAGPEKYHGDVTALEHSLNVVKFLEGESTEILLAGLLHDLGKGVTEKDLLPHHYNHDKVGVPLVRSFCKRLRVPRRVSYFCELVVKEHLNLHRVTEKSRPKTFLRLLDAFKAVHSTEALVKALKVVHADSLAHRGGKGSKVQKDLLFKALRAVPGGSELSSMALGVPKNKVREVVWNARCTAVAREFGRG